MRRRDKSTYEFLSSILNFVNTSHGKPFVSIIKMLKDLYKVLVGYWKKNPITVIFVTQLKLA